MVCVITVGVKLIVVRLSVRREQERQVLSMAALSGSATKMPDSQRATKEGEKTLTTSFVMAKTERQTTT